MNKEEKKVEEAKVEEEFLEEDDDFFEDYDDADLATARKIHSVKAKAKKVGKVALVIGGIALLGVVGVGVAIAVGAAKKEEEESKKSDRDWDRYDRDYYRDEEGFTDKEISEPMAEATTESTEAA